MRWHYHIYGLSLQSAIALPYAPSAKARSPGTKLVIGSASLFAKIKGKAGIPQHEGGPAHAKLPDGSTYLRRPGVDEFLISTDGRRLTGRTLNGNLTETFRAYPHLCTQLLSFALLHQGIEPLHATAVVADDQVMAFLGDSGYGKSSLGAAFLQAGYRLLTDDVLVVKEHGTNGHRFVAMPGSPQIKLFPEIARTLLGRQANGTPMNPTTSKLVLPLSPESFARTAAPLRAIYVLRPPHIRNRSTTVSIRSLPHRRALLELIANTFNPIVVEPTRLKQQFEQAVKLALAVPVKSVTYPRDLARLPSVVEAIQADLSR